MRGTRRIRPLWRKCPGQSSFKRSGVNRSGPGGRCPGVSARIVKVGFVGAGYVATRHAETLSRLDGVGITAVADPRADRTERFSRLTGARPYRGHEEMFAREPLDAVYICVPPAAHGPPERAAIQHDLPFFVEKPLACDVATAESIAALVKDHALATGTGYHWRYLDTVERAAELLTETPPLLVLGFWLDRTPGADWWIRQDQSGGQLVEQATHLFDLARLLVGDFEVVHADASRLPGAADGEIHRAATASLRFSSGAIGTIAATCVLDRGYRMSIEFFCTGRTVTLSEQELVVEDATGRWTMTAHGDPFLREDADFIGAVREAHWSMRAPYGEALRTHRLACAAADAAYAGTACEAAVHD
jgi:myo-inositol 2-dehydrogenase/D-chiro-inositol 1-dehydrogenase